MQHKKVPPTPLGDNLSEIAGQETLRDAPVVLKLRRKVVAFLVTFFAAEKSDWHVGPPPTTLNLKLKQKNKTSEYPITTKKLTHKTLSSKELASSSHPIPDDLDTKRYKVITLMNLKPSNLLIKINSPKSTQIKLPSNVSIYINHRYRGASK